jgi:hypothetical protein
LAVVVEETIHVALGDELHGSEVLGGRLEEMIEEAARVLQRPLAIDDRRLRLLVYTEHPQEDVDDVRLASVLKRPLAPELLDWFRRDGIGTANPPIRPVRVEGNEPLGLRSRVCIPIYCHEYPLGYLWLIDADRSLSTEDLDRACQIADDAGVILYREMLLRDLDRGREREYLRDLLSDDREIRDNAICGLAERDLLTGSGPFLVLICRVADESGSLSPEAVRLELDVAMMCARRKLAPKHGLHLVRPGYALLLVSLADPGLRVDGIGPFAAGLHDELASATSHQEGMRVIVSIGAAVSRLDEAVSSHGQALRAADVADAVSSFGDVVSWEELGVYGLLAELPPSPAGLDLIPPGLNALLDDPRTHPLVRTLECYLDNAGDAQATAAALFLHRTTLWHRLRRIEEAAAVDLRNGDDRLLLHLGLKLARLQGRTWIDPASPESAKEAVGAPGRK